MNFWNQANIDFVDMLNAEIWAKSPAKQLALQAPSMLSAPFSVGAQQAMIDSDDSAVLSWVPDLVGTSWREPGSLMIVGSAYAGFIAEFSTRGKAMPLATYKACTSVEQFQRRFLEHVVDGDYSYYGALATLASSFGNASRLTVSDLCRASFVQRGQRDGSAGDRIVIAHAKLFSEYVDCSMPWTWRRIVDSQAQCIVALGSIAEQGLLRLFRGK